MNTLLSVVAASLFFVSNATAQDTNIPSNAVLIGVQVPANALIWFDDHKTSQTGQEREFMTPALKPGRHRYRVRARWTDTNGKTVSRTRTIAVRPGERIGVSFFETPDDDYPEARDALDEVNALRTRMRLRPFVRDDYLSKAARSAATYRAAYLMAGHTSNDFAHVPPGGLASASGCAAWEPSWGWGSCCTEESWTYAGAAYVMGRDGRRYMHLFVR
jgi:uncharacterized protein (TIGR03000 family)